MNMLTLSHVSRRFGEKQVLKDVSFTVPEQTIFGFVGPNGAGKTTTMKIILGLLAADSGSITVNGEDVHFGQNKTNRHIGYLPDVPEFYGYMTPTEYLSFCGQISDMPSGELHARIEELLSLVGLSGESGRIRGFSRGMKQRLGIAQALLHRPRLLICDEPTSALDPIGRKEILDILIAAKEQTTVLFSTHILSDVERICDEIAFLKDGTIMLEGTLDEIKKAHKSTGFLVELAHAKDAEAFRSAFTLAHQTGNAQFLFEENSPVAMEDVFRFLLEHHIPVLKVESQEPTLESLFLEVAGINPPVTDTDGALTSDRR